MDPSFIISRFSDDVQGLHTDGIHGLRISSEIKKSKKEKDNFNPFSLCHDLAVIHDEIVFKDKSQKGWFYDTVMSRADETSFIKFLESWEKLSPVQQLSIGRYFDSTSVGDLFYPPALGSTKLEQDTLFGWLVGSWATKMLCFSDHGAIIKNLLSESNKDITNRIPPLLKNELAHLMLAGAEPSEFKRIMDIGWITSSYVLSGAHIFEQILSNPFVHKSSGLPTGFLLELQNAGVWVFDCIPARPQEGYYASGLHAGKGPKMNNVFSLVGVSKRERDLRVPKLKGYHVLRSIAALDGLNCPVGTSSGMSILTQLLISHIEQGQLTSGMERVLRLNFESSSDWPMLQSCIEAKELRTLCRVVSASGATCELDRASDQRVLRL